MANGRRFSGKRLPLTLAFGVLVAVAIGAGCNGFFVGPTLTSITINPTSPSVQVGDTATLSAYGVNNQGQGSYLTSGVSWSSSDASVVVFTDNCGKGIDTCASETSGSATVEGLALGSSTITATAESVTNTTTATVYMQISEIGIEPQTASVTVGDTQAFIVYANGDSGLTNPNDDLSLQATLTVTQNGSAVSTPACSPVSTDTPPDQQCTTSGATTGVTYTITATYPGTTLTATAKLTVNAAP